MSASESPLFTDYTAHQVVPEPERIVILTEGTRVARDEDPELVDYTGHTFYLQDGEVTGKTSTFTYKEHQTAEGPIRALVRSTSAPLEVAEGSRAELRMPEGEPLNYDDPWSPVATFKTGISRILSRNPQAIPVEPPQPPVLRIYHPQEPPKK